MNKDDDDSLIFLLVLSEVLLFSFRFVLSVVTSLSDFDSLTFLFVLSVVLVFTLVLVLSLVLVFVLVLLLGLVFSFDLVKDQGYCNQKFLRTK